MKTSELETKPSRAFNLYPNVIVKQRDTVLKPWNAKETHSTSYPNVTEKQRDTVLKPSNAERIHNPTFDFPKQKSKLSSKQFENPIPKIYLNDNPTKNDPNNKNKFQR